MSASCSLLRYVKAIHLRQCVGVDAHLDGYRYVQ
jgi:hypothetical protein